MSIQIFSGETALAFAERFYCEAQVLVICERLYLDDTDTAAVFSVASQPHINLYLKGNCYTITLI